MTKSLTFVEMDLPRCANVYGQSPCRARLMSDDYEQVGVNFDGANDYLTRGADLTGSADAKTGLLSFWMRVDGGDGVYRVLLENGGAFFQVSLDTANKLAINGYSSAPVNVLSYLSITTFPSGEGWHHVLATWSLSLSRLQVYIDDVLDAGTGIVTTNTDIDYTRTEWSVGGRSTAAFKFTGDLGDFWFDQASTSDLSVEATRRKFVDANIRPVDLGSDGSTPLGSAPDVYLSSTLAAWHTNKGTGGGFTLNGALTASAGGSAPFKCFNTKGTCQDPDDYVDGTPVTLRFVKPAYYYKDVAADFEAIPSIMSVNVTPCVVSLGKDLGQRASVSVTFKDHPDDDTYPGLDPYLDERDYTPYEQGTFWGKFRAREPYIPGEKIRVTTGYVGQDFADMETRHFLIESYDSSAKGQYTIVGSDVLKLIDSEKAVAPLPSPGFLVANITNSDTAMTLTPSGSGSDYPNAGYINLGGSELVSFEHDPTAGNDANCILLIKASGADASTTFTDTSTSARALTANGNVQVDTAQFFFGNSSILFDGTGDFISAVDAAAFTFAGDFTLECRARFNSLAGDCVLICHSTDINNMYRLFVASTGVLAFQVISASSTIILVVSAAGLITTGTWYHLAVTRSGNVFKIYIDGVEVGTTTDSDAIPNFTSTLKIGISGDGSSNAMNGWIDMVRISNVARWTDDFDPLYDTGRYATSVDTFFITRAQLNTTAAAHQAQDRAQLVLAYVGYDPAAIVYDLFVTYTPGFDAAWVSYSTWYTETSTYNGNLYTTYITEPTSVKTLQEELIKQAALAIWWDDVEEQLRLQVLRSVSTLSFDYTPDNYLRNTAQIREQLDKRLSQVLVYFGQINPLLPLSNKDNYRSFASGVATGNWNTEAIETILSRWIPQSGRTVADRLTEIILGMYQTPPRSVSFEVYRYDETDPLLGVGYHFYSAFVQDATGAVDSAYIPFQATQIKFREDAFVVSGEEVLFQAPPTDLASRNITIDANRTSLNLRNEHDSIYPTPDGTETVTFTINSGILIGSSSTSTPAIELGTWPVGTTLNLINSVGSEIQGAGGAGGAGAVAPSPVFDGSAGGTALRLTRALNLTNLGTISGGGGGGGGGGGTGFAFGGGGGGGAGTSSGAGGSGANNGSSGTASSGGAGGAGGPSAGAGGAGGGKGAAGSNGVGVSSFAGGVGGAAGPAVDGTSFVTYVSSGTINGSQIN